MVAKRKVYQQIECCHDITNNYEEKYELFSISDIYTNEINMHNKFLLTMTKKKNYNQ